MNSDSAEAVVRPPYQLLLTVAHVCEVEEGLQAGLAALLGEGKGMSDAGEAFSDTEGMAAATGQIQAALTLLRLLREGLAPSPSLPSVPASSSIE